MSVTAVLIAMGCAILGAGAAKAHAEELGGPFCSNWPLNPLGQPFDYCTEPAYRYNKVVEGYGEYHSACVSTTVDGTKAGVNTSWACTPGPRSSVLNGVNKWAWTEAIIRNNTTGDSNVVSGNRWYCSPEPGC
jgi:hypothetical protein